MILTLLKKHFPEIRYPVKYVIRKKALGDVLWVEPVIRKLLERSKKVVLITDYTDLFKHYPNPNVRFKKELNPFEKLLFFFDRLGRQNLLFINLNDSYERLPKMHILLAYFMASKVNDRITYPQLHVRDEYLQIAAPLGKKYVVLHLEDYGANNNFRNIYGIAWKEIIKFLNDKGYKVVQIGNESLVVDGTIFVKTNVQELMGLIKHATFFIGPDSGPSHIAAAVDLPSILFFGSINPAYRHRIDIFKGIILQQPCEYAYCFHEKYNRVRTSCILFGKEGIPKCSLHSNAIVQQAIEQLLSKYQL